MKKPAVVLAALLLVSMVPVPASAAECVKKITSYWGYDVGGGEVLCQWDLGPYIPPSVVGQKIRECDGYTWTWGNTTCTYYTPTIDYEDCPPCNLAEADTAQCPVAETAE